MRPELIEHQLTWFRCSQSSVVTMTRVTSNCTRRVTGSTCNRVSSVQSDGCERGLKLIGSNGTQFIDDQLPCRPACSPPPRHDATPRCLAPPPPPPSLYRTGMPRRAWAYPEIVGTARIACGAGSVKPYGVRLSVCRNMGPPQSRCCRFAAVGPAGRRYRLTAAAAAGECGQCHRVVIVRRYM